jgi:hypothetical protein
LPSFKSGVAERSAEEMTERFFLWAAPLTLDADEVGRAGSEIVIAALLADLELTAAVLARWCAELF